MTVKQFSTAQIDTPYLLIDKNKFLSNIQRAKNQFTSNETVLRPHLKTIKSIDAAKYLLDDFSSPATVATLCEAEAFAKAGYKDLIYAVGISAKKLPRIHRIQQQGCDISILLDSVEQAKDVAFYSKSYACAIPVYIEIDCDGHRGVVKVDSADLIVIARILQQAGNLLKGVLTHAGESYSCTTKDELTLAAENERETAVFAANKLKEHGLNCPKVSIGSTPTMFSYGSLDGVTDVRAGVFTFFDLVMAGVGVCKISDIAMSVVTTVIGFNEEKNWLFIDAGWMALSRDRGTQSQANDCGYGLVCDINGKVIANLKVDVVNQEHGIVKCHSNNIKELIPIGAQLRILPNHACATGAMHPGYYVQSSEQNCLDFWPRIQGWN